METIEKAPTGISGLDDILNGGVPRGRPTLLWGGPGCGKTVLAVEFLCRGVLEFDEPGLMISFEESPEDITLNCSQFQFGFREAMDSGTFHIEQIALHRDHVVEAGEFTFDAFLVRLEKLLAEYNVRRLVLDSLDTLFAGFTNTANLRFEYARIFEWIKKKQVTVLITSGYSQGAGIPNFLQEHLLDCVIYLDHRLDNQISKRRLRVVKYRGSSHGSDEYPYLIGERGIILLPITSLELSAVASDTTFSTGIEGLDDMFGGKGYYAGSATMISGGPGTGKSTVAVRIAGASCERGDKSLLISFEESTGQILRNMRSVGIDLLVHINNELLRIIPFRPSRFGLEEHLVHLHALVSDFHPATVVLDPITSFTTIGNSLEIQSMLARLLDYLKKEGVSTILTSLSSEREMQWRGETEVTSIVDNWITLNLSRKKKFARREIAVLKARGMKNLNESYELVLSEKGVSAIPWKEKI